MSIAKSDILKFRHHYPTEEINFIHIIISDIFVMFTVFMKSRKIFVSIKGVVILRFDIQSSNKSKNLLHTSRSVESNFYKFSFVTGAFICSYTIVLLVMYFFVWVIFKRILVRSGRMICSKNTINNLKVSTNIPTLYNNYSGSLVSSDEMGFRLSFKNFQSVSNYFQVLYDLNSLHIIRLVNLFFSNPMHVYYVSFLFLWPLL